MHTCMTGYVDFMIGCVIALLRGFVLVGTGLKFWFLHPQRLRHMLGSHNLSDLSICSYEYVCYLVEWMLGWVVVSALF